MFVHSRSSLENHTLFQTKMNKPCTRFHTKTAQKPFPLRRHIPIWLLSIGEYPPLLLLGWRRAMSAVFSALCFKNLVSSRAVTTLGTRGFFSRATRSFRRVSAAGRHVFGRRPKKRPETAHEKSLAPRVGCH